MKKCKYKLNITASTWTKESNELFDYESADLTRQDIEIESPGTLFRERNEISFKQINLNETMSPIIKEKLLGVEINSKDYYLNFKSTKNPYFKEATWITLRYFQSNKYDSGYKLSPGSLIKFGRVTLKIREIQIEGTKLNIYDLYKELTKPNIIVNTINKSTMKKKICRVCYSDDKEVDSPLINPCHCSGGLKYIHLSCLQQWLKSKSALSISSNENCSIHTFNQIECELCKFIFPDFIKIDGTYIKIWDLAEVNFKNYISLESVPIKGKKNIYIVSFDKKNKIKIGRSHEADFRITDVTVSRFHAEIIKTSNNIILLKDLNSKFGSLIYLNLNKIQMVRKLSLPIQIGRTCMIFSIIHNWSFCECMSFLSTMKKDHYDYCDINAKEIEIDKVLSVKVQMVDESENIENEKISNVSNDKKKWNAKDIKELVKEVINNPMEELNTLNYVTIDNTFKK